IGTLKNRARSPSEHASELGECLSLSLAAARNAQMIRRFLSLKPGIFGSLGFFVAFCR
ncbi:hypothetical protein A2U01_0078309, partial [Trifolium medium]|nr:hypothetical protein [Trifolium medium]